jgi:hypothetical protein
LNIRFQVSRDQKRGLEELPRSRRTKNPRRRRRLSKRIERNGDSFSIKEQ